MNSKTTNRLLSALLLLAICENSAAKTLSVLKDHCEEKNIIIKTDTNISFSNEQATKKQNELTRLSIQMEK